MQKKKKTITKNRNQISTVLLIFQVYDFDFKVISQKHVYLQRQFTSNSRVCLKPNNIAKDYYLCS